jgi:hypothetical protein
LHTVNILATVRTAELLDAALLVFRTVRVGFPTATINVWGNALAYPFERAVAKAAKECGAFVNNLPATQHDIWLEGLLHLATQPFWVCDTDVVFWDSLEEFKLEMASGVAMAGRFEPAFDEEFTGTLHMERLHTAVMYLHPAHVRARMRAWVAAIPEGFAGGRTADFPFVRQHFIPVLGQRAVFYDTCAGLWQAGIGSEFDEVQNDCFDHLHCATYVDRIASALSVDLVAAHRAIYADHNRARGMRHEQQKYYERLAPKGNNALFANNLR